MRLPQASLRTSPFRRPVRTVFALCAFSALPLLSSCDVQRPETAETPTTRTVAFKVSAEDRDKVGEFCDRILVHAVRDDSSERRDFTFRYSDTLSALPIVLPDLAQSGTWRITAEFVDSSGMVRFEAIARITWHIQSPRATAVDAVVVASCRSGCATEPPPDSSRPMRLDTMVLLALKDVSIDREGWNLGRESNLRLFYDDALGLIDFGRLDTILRGRRVVLARLVVHGWISPAAESSPLVVGTASREWIEGTGNWYWWDGTGHNDFATAYANYLGFVPAGPTENPATASGVRWNSSVDLRASLEPVADTSVSLPIPPRAGAYPLAWETRRIDFDVTRAVQSMGETGARSFALGQAGASTGAQTTAIFFFSRENPAGAQYGPRLEIVLAP